MQLCFDAYLSHLAPSNVSASALTLLSKKQKLSRRNVTKQAMVVIEVINYLKINL